MHFTGVSILLIPLSFNFVDSLCVATVLGFACAVSNRIISNGMFATSSKVAVTGSQGISALETNQRNKILRVSSTFPTRGSISSTLEGGSGSIKTSATIPESEEYSPGSSLPLRMPVPKSLSKPMPRHKSLPSMPASWAATSRFDNHQEGKLDAEEGGQGQHFCHVPSHFPTQRPPQQRLKSTYLVPSTLDAEVEHVGRSSISSTLREILEPASSRGSVLSNFRRVKVGTRSSRVRSKLAKSGGINFPQTIESANGATVHWKLALVAAVELVLKVVNDQSQPS